MSPATASVADLDAYLDSVLEDALRVVGATEGSLMLLSPRENTLEIVKRRGPPYDPKRKHRRFRVGVGVAGRPSQSKFREATLAASPGPNMAVVAPGGGMAGKSRQIATTSVPTVMQLWPMAELNRPQKTLSVTTIWPAAATPVPPSR